MTEKDIVNGIMRYLKTVPNTFCWKEHGGMYGTAGLPDVICCIGGRFVAFEVKTPTGKLSKLQEITIRNIISAKGEAFMVTSVEAVRAIVSELRSKTLVGGSDFDQKGIIAAVLAQPGD